MTEILDVVKDMARDLENVGALDENTKRTIDALCSPPANPAAKTDHLR